MYLTLGDTFAITLALVSLIAVLALAFRRIAVLEKQAVKYRKELRKNG